MFASSEKTEGVRERETRKNQLNQLYSNGGGGLGSLPPSTTSDPLLVMPVVKPPHLR